MRGFLWTLINDESVTSFAATPWIPKKSYAFFITKNRSLSLAEVLQGGSFPREGIPYFYDAVIGGSTYGRPIDKQLSLTKTWSITVEAFGRHLKSVDASALFFVCM